MHNKIITPLFLAVALALPHVSLATNTLPNGNEASIQQAPFDKACSCISPKIMPS